MMKKLTLVAALCLLAACDRNRSGAEGAVRDVLKDPESAQFGEFYYNSKTQRGCLVVNAKNSMGGYTGDQIALVVKGSDGWDTYGIEQYSMKLCRDAHADRAG